MLRFFSFSFVSIFLSGFYLLLRIVGCSGLWKREMRALSVWCVLIEETNLIFLHLQAWGSEDKTPDLPMENLLFTTTWKSGWLHSSLILFHSHLFLPKIPCYLSLVITTFSFREASEANDHMNINQSFCLSWSAMALFVLLFLIDCYRTLWNYWRW